MELERTGESPLTVQTDLTPQKLANLRDEFYLQLEKFWPMVGVGLEGRSFNAVQKAMQHLHGLGRLLNRNIFGADYEKVRAMFLRACPTWRNADSEDYLAPVIEVRALLEHMLPFEFIPIFDMNEPPGVSRFNELEPLAARFLGFSTAIRRIFADPEDESASPQKAPSCQLDNEPRLSVRFFKHAGLEGAKEEQKFFRGAPWIDLRGPWPDREIAQQQFTTELVTEICRGSVAGVAIQHPPDHIQHFACHCNTTRQNPFGHTLYLAHDTGWFSNEGYARRAVIRDLQRELPPLARARAGDPYTLVFLNACGAAKLTPEGAASFIDLFLKLGNRGVIGSEVRVPDVFAAAFSQQFYLNLIRKFSLGDAILRARWTLWKIKHNPLGILYAVYADPYLSVRRHYLNATSTSAEP